MIQLSCSPWGRGRRISSTHECDCSICKREGCTELQLRASLIDICRRKGRLVNWGLRILRSMWTHVMLHVMVRWRPLPARDIVGTWRACTWMPFRQNGAMYVRMNSTLGSSDELSYRNWMRCCITRTAREAVPIRKSRNPKRSLTRSHARRRCRFSHHLATWQRLRRQIASQSYHLIS